MDNNRQSPQTNLGYSENSSKSKSRVNSKRIIILALAALTVLIASVYLFYLHSQSIKTTSAIKENDSCPLAGQTARGQVINDPKTKFTNSSISNLEKSGEIVARVLSTKPFVVEVIDLKKYANDLLTDTLQDDDFGVQSNWFVAESEKNIVSTLKFNDVITANLYPFTYADKEIGIGVKLIDIRKSSGNINYFSNSPQPVANRSGTLIRYKPKPKGSGSLMLIFNDGKVFYRDDKSNVIKDKQLTKQELDDLLKLFGHSKFNNMASDFSVYQSTPSLSLLCSRYQPISLENNASQVKPITDKLDSIINTYLDQATLKLTYMKKYTIKNWMYESIIPLDKATENYRYREENMARLSQLKPTESQKSELIDSPYYRYKGKLYSIQFGDCSDAPKDTWACLFTQELEMEPNNMSVYQVWPSEMMIKLKNIDASKSVVIPHEDYEAHKDFYDGLFAREYVFLEGDNFYTNLHLSKE